MELEALDQVRGRTAGASDRSRQGSGIHAHTARARPTEDNANSKPRAIWRYKRICTRSNSLAPIDTPRNNGNPLRVVLWLVEELKRRGETLQAGDRLSLGSVGRLFPLKERGKTYTYTLIGLPGSPVSTSVSIE